MFQRHHLLWSTVHYDSNDCPIDTELTQDTDELISGLAYIIADLIVIVICLYGFCKLFTKLYEYQMYCICFICPVFSDKYQWIDYNFKPSALAKITASIVPIIFILVGIFWAILEVQYIAPFMCWSTWYSISIIPAVLGNGVYYIYYWFITSMLRSFRKQDDLFKAMISDRLFYFIRGLIGVDMVIFIIKMILYRFLTLYPHKYYDNIPYLIIYYICNAISSILIDGSLLFAYYRGFDNIALWYDQRHGNKNNDKVHEILKIITRCSTIMMVSVTCNVLLCAFDIWHYYGFLHHYANQDTQERLKISGNIFWNGLVVVNTMTYLLTIYFIFPFGQKMHDKVCYICCHCDAKMYKKCLKRHQTKTKCVYIKTNNPDLNEGILKQNSYNNDDDNDVCVVIQEQD